MVFFVRGHANARLRRADGFAAVSPSIPKGQTSPNVKLPQMSVKDSRKLLEISQSLRIRELCKCTDPLTLASKAWEKRVLLLLADLAPDCQWVGLLPVQKSGGGSNSR